MCLHQIQICFFPKWANAVNHLQKLGSYNEVIHLVVTWFPSIASSDKLLNQTTHIECNDTDIIPCKSETQALRTLKSCNANDLILPLLCQLLECGIMF